MPGYFDTSAMDSARSARPNEMFFPGWKPLSPAMRQYAERWRLTFPYWDGQCCHRVCKCIQEMDAPL